MKHIKTFQQLNEGLEVASSSDLDKQFKQQVKSIEDISKSILGSKELKDLLATAQKENPDVKQFRKYFDLASKSEKLVKKMRSNGMSSNKREARKQIEAITKFADSLKEGFGIIKNFKKKAEKGLETKEGLGNIVGNTLRNILTGKFIVNILKSVKSNLVDSYNEYNTVQDMFDIKDY